MDQIKLNLFIVFPENGQNNRSCNMGYGTSAQGPAIKGRHLERVVQAGHGQVKAPGEDEVQEIPSST